MLCLLYDGVVYAHAICLTRYQCCYGFQDEDSSQIWTANYCCTYCIHLLCLPCLMTMRACRY